VKPAKYCFGDVTCDCSIGIVCKPAGEAYEKRDMRPKHIFDAGHHERFTYSRCEFAMDGVHLNRSGSIKLTEEMGQYAQKWQNNWSPLLRSPTGDLKTASGLLFTPK